MGFPVTLEIPSFAMALFFLYASVISEAMVFVAVIALSIIDGAL